MSITAIKKIEIIGLEQDKQEMLNFLQKLGMVEIFTCRTADHSSFAAGAPVSPAVNIAELDDAIAFLANYKAKPGVLDSFVKLKPLVYKKELETIVNSFMYKEVLAELALLREEQKTVIQHKERLLQEGVLLTPWKSLSVPFENLYGGHLCGILLGIVRINEYENLTDICLQRGIPVFWEIISRDKVNVHVSAIYVKQYFEAFEALLKEYRFNAVTLGRHPGIVQERLSVIHDEIIHADTRLEEIKNRFIVLSDEQFKLMVVFDYYANKVKVHETGTSCQQQKFTFSLGGWIRNKDFSLVTREISGRFKNSAVFVSEPAPGEDIPIALEQKTVLQPFEVVTDLYGQPVYNGQDPTALLAPFFAISFGFCMLDAGYGLILIAAAAFFLSQKNMSYYGKRLWKLFLYMGVTTLFAGIITGSFFGDLISRLPDQFSGLKAIQRKFTLFDSVKDALMFLGFTLALGFIQVWTGVCIKFIRDIKMDKFTAFVLDAPTLCVQMGLLVFLLSYFKVLPAFIVPYTAVVLIVSAGAIIYYQWKTNTDIGLKIFWSIFGIYSIVTGNFLADTLSFSRIFALGLTGGLLGMAINTMLFPSFPITNVGSFISAAILVCFLIFGHVLNLAISILGAYVHTSRLQYLEFFTKFFEAGGRRFRPFKEETKYIFLSE
ncbi:MAG: V-type ATPase 116kDa subunit family protein [Candidatus Omnitrophica bacterium]|nr:V-type ATPase 116kDa subunit family protein [Candidatus Omnitrophota bacterium]